MSQDTEQPSGFNLHRRRFLKFLGASSALAVSNQASGQVRFKKVDAKTIEKVDIRPELLATKPYISLKLLRPEDLLSLELRYHGFNLQQKRLRRTQSDAFLVVIFQPQSITEEAGVETVSGLTMPELPSRMFIGGESRLVFRLPSSLQEIPIDAETLLGWDDYELEVNPRARAPRTTYEVKPEQIRPSIKTLGKQLQAPNPKTVTAIPRGLSKTEIRDLQLQVIYKDTTATVSRREAIKVTPGITGILAKEIPGAPGELETSIEVPNRLYLSPTKSAAWKHRITLGDDEGLVKQANRLFELWHTRLAQKTTYGIDESELTASRRILRALWADDAENLYTESVALQELDKDIGLTSMTNRNRHQIVHESSNFSIARFTPPPIQAYRLFLTTLGAWLDSLLEVERENLEAAGILSGTGKPNSELNLLKWRHIETLGREHYVEIVEAGNILPFGHKAVKVTITERKPHKESRTATPFQRELVVITEPKKTLRSHR